MKSPRVLTPVRPVGVLASEPVLQWPRPPLRSDRAMPTATMSPSSFVNKVLWRLPVQQTAGATVALRAYVCGNGKNDINAKLMRAALVAAGQKNNFRLPAADKRNSALFEQLFTGQGSPLAFWQMFMTVCLWKNDIKAFGASKGKPGPFDAIIGSERPDAAIIQDLIDQSYFGMDCIGFVGRYLEAAGLMPGYPGLYPRQYLDLFRPVLNLSEIEDLCVLVWADGTHIAIVDQVVRRPQANGVQVTELVVCQSANNGPIVNEGARIVETNAPDVLDIAAYNRGLAPLQAQLNAKQLTHEQYETERKALLKASRLANVSFGYLGGRLFNFAAPKSGYPAGLVYVGKLRDVTRRYTA